MVDEEIIKKKKHFAIVSSNRELNINRGKINMTRNHPIN